MCRALCNRAGSDAQFVSALLNGAITAPASRCRWLTNSRPGFESDERKTGSATPRLRIDRQGERCSLGGRGCRGVSTEKCYYERRVSGASASSHFIRARSRKVRTFTVYGCCGPNTRRLMVATSPSTATASATSPRDAASSSY